MGEIYPKVPFGVVDPLQDYYVDTEGKAYSVARLVDEAEGLKPFDMPLAGMRLDDKIWEGCDIYATAWHVRRVWDADLTKPIILSWDGAIADGRHRIIKALALGKRTIKAVRITWKVSHDWIEND